MTYEEIISASAELASGVVKLMCQLDINDCEETRYLDIAFHNLRSFAVVYRHKKGFQGGLKYGKQKDDED